MFQRVSRVVSYGRISRLRIQHRVAKTIEEDPTNRKWLTRFLFTASLTIGGPRLTGVWGFMKKSEPKEPILTAREFLLEKADALYDQGHYKAIYELLDKYRENADVEILWRLSRALYHMSKTASDVEAKKMIYEGYDLLTTALSIDDNCYAVHKWMSVLLDAKCSLEGMKARIAELHNVKAHMMRATELNPKDATTLYMLGSWCFHVSELKWYQRKLASAIFGEPPKSTFEEALKYFENAEKVDPKFYSLNLLMLGKTCLKLKKNEDAIRYLKMASEFSAKTDEDHDVKKEALKLLSTLERS